jgi:hypothetical protein
MSTKSSTKQTYWQTQQIKSFAKEICHQHGDGWPYLVPEVRTAIVDAKILSILLSQDRAFIHVASIVELHQRLHSAMGTG